MRISDWSSDVCSADLDDQGHELNTPEHGRAWAATPISGAASDLRNPTSPWGAAQKFSVLWMKGRYDGFRDFRTGIRGSTTGLVPVTLGMSVPSDWRRTGRITGIARQGIGGPRRSEEHTSELQSLMRISYAVFCLKKQNTTKQ